MKNWEICGETKGKTQLVEINITVKRILGNQNKNYCTSDLVTCDGLSS